MVGPDPGNPGDPGRAWGWVAALRAGSTTPWSQWSFSAGTAPATARDIPGAQQLELLRRVNLTQQSGTGGAPPVRLVERILTASATGRGAPDLELLGAVEDRAWGPRPVDPTALSDAELLRFAATLLAEDVVAADPGGRRSRFAAVSRLPPRVRRLSRRGRGHRIVGDPWLALTIRDEMLRRGRPLGGPKSTVVVVGHDAASMLVDAFTTRAFDGGVASWERWLGSGSGRSLPRRADLTVVARRWSDAIGPGRVAVVPDPALVPRALRLPARAQPRLTPPRPSADAVDLARRLTAPLGLLVPPEERRRLLRRGFLPMLLADNALHPAAPLAVPDSHLAWVVRRAERMRDDLRAAGYPVVGDLQSLVPVSGAVNSAGASGTGPCDVGVLALALRLLAAAPQTEEGEDR